MSTEKWAPLNRVRSRELKRPTYGGGAPKQQIPGDKLLPDNIVIGPAVPSPYNCPPDSTTVLLVILPITSNVPSTVVGPLYVLLPPKLSLPLFSVMLRGPI